MSLAQVTTKTRFVLKLGGIIIAGLILLFLILKVKNILFPPPPPSPTVSFGKLPSLEFPKGEDSKNLTYSVDTISGTLPVFPTLEKVFKMDEKKPDLLSLDKANSIAKALGFEDKPVGVSENVFQWKQKDGKTLTMNILNFNFNYSTNYLSGPKIPNFSKDNNLAISSSVDFLQRMGLLYDDLDQTKTKTSFFLVKNFDIVPVTSLSSAQIIRVEFFQKTFNNLPIYYSSTSPLNFLIKTERDEPQVVEANFFHQKPSESFSTYPLKSAQQALGALKKGDAYISDLPATQKIAIKKVTIGYYISDKKQDFLIPIIIFEGDNFRAFVTAVKDEWVNK